MIPGDGIGPEVTAQAVRVVETVARCGGRALETVFFDFGADRYLREGVSLPTNFLDRFRSEFDAILLGALGTLASRTTNMRGTSFSASALALICTPISGP